MRVKKGLKSSLSPFYGFSLSHACFRDQINIEMIDGDQFDQFLPKKFPIFHYLYNSPIRKSNVNSGVFKNKIDVEWYQGISTDGAIISYGDVDSS
jgi:hypothetical protein